VNRHAVHKKRSENAFGTLVYQGLDPVFGSFLSSTLALFD
jgi:hypothetical protein